MYLTPFGGLQEASQRTRHVAEHWRTDEVRLRYTLSSSPGGRSGKGVLRALAEEWGEVLSGTRALRSVGCWALLFKELEFWKAANGFLRRQCIYICIWENPCNEIGVKEEKASKRESSWDHHNDPVRNGGILSKASAVRGWRGAGVGRRQTDLSIVRASVKRLGDQSSRNWRRLCEMIVCVSLFTCY